MKTLDRYLVMQYLGLLSAGTLLIGGIFFGTGEFQAMISLVCRMGVPWTMVMAIFVLNLPGIFINCLPASALMSSAIVLTRMNVDNEILALRVLGLSPWRIMAPFFLLAGMTALMAFSLSEWVQPRATNLSKDLCKAALSKGQLPATNTTITTQKTDLKTGSQQTILVPDYDGNDLRNVIVLDRNYLTRETRITWAEKGLWKKGEWNLNKGSVYDVSDNENGKAVMHFEHMAIRADLDSRISDLRPCQLTIGQLMTMQKGAMARKLPVPPILILSIQERLAQPAACILLIFAVLPLTLTRRRGRSYASLILVSGLVVTYFVLREACESMAFNMRMNATIAPWIPGIAVFFLGLLWAAKGSDLPAIPNPFAARPRKRRYDQFLESEEREYSPQGRTKTPV